MHVPFVGAGEAMRGLIDRQSAKCVLGEVHGYVVDVWKPLGAPQRWLNMTNKWPKP